jgi:hypothetical protein
MMTLPSSTMPSRMSRRRQKQQTALDCAARPSAPPFPVQNLILIEYAGEKLSNAAWARRCQLTTVAPMIAMLRNGQPLAQILAKHAR